MLAAASIIAGVSPGNEEREKEEAVAKLAAVFTSQLRDALRDGMQNHSGYQLDIFVGAISETLQKNIVCVWK